MLVWLTGSVVGCCLSYGSGISVTPVVGYIGEITELDFTPNDDEVDQCFTVTFEELHKTTNWVHRYRDGVQCDTPVFNGGEYLVWGLTAFLLSHFMSVMNANIWKKTGKIYPTRFTGSGSD